MGLGALRESARESCEQATTGMPSLLGQNLQALGDIREISSCWRLSLRRPPEALISCR